MTDQEVRTMALHVSVFVEARFVRARRASNVGRRLRGPSDESSGLRSVVSGRIAVEGDADEEPNAWAGFTDISMRASA